MVVIELTILEIKPTVRLLDESLMRNLRAIRDQLGTNSRFYYCPSDPRLLFILGQWESLEEHQEFLASDRKDIVLGPQESQTTFKESFHFEPENGDSVDFSAEYCGPDLRIQLTSKPIPAAEVSHLIGKLENASGQRACVAETFEDNMGVVITSKDAVHLLEATLAEDGWKPFLTWCESPSNDAPTSSRVYIVEDLEILFNKAQRVS